jgi:hypothetical protein
MIKKKQITFQFDLLIIEDYHLIYAMILLALKMHGCNFHCLV